MASAEAKIRRIVCVAAVATFALAPEISRADEGGFWVPGFFGSLAATPL